jgi:hypothetical protein
MNKILQLIMLGWVLTSPAFAQQSGNLTLTTADGTQVRGLVMTMTADEVTLQGSSGIYTLKRSQLTPDSQKAILKFETGDDGETLKRKVAEQERVIAALRAENQQLRAALVQSGSTKPAPVAPAVQSSNAAPSSGSINSSAVSNTGGYWISSTGKRHNSSCRYYQTSKGRQGTADEGVACKICGG